MHSVCVSSQLLVSFIAVPTNNKNLKFFLILVDFSVRFYVLFFF